MKCQWPDRIINRSFQESVKWDMILLSETFRRGEKMETLVPGGSFNLSAQGPINKFRKTNKLQ